MNGLDLAGLGAVFGGVALIIGAISSFYNSIKNTKTIKHTAVIANKTAEKVEAIDHAVNGKAKGAETIGEQVDDLHSDRPPPVPIPAEVTDAALLPLVRQLVAYHEQERQEAVADKLRRRGSKD